MKAFMEVEISEAEKTKCDRMFYWGFFGDSGLCGRFASFFLGVCFGAPGRAAVSRRFRTWRMYVYFLF